jgi:hypothetical protein
MARPKVLSPGQRVPDTRSLPLPSWRSILSSTLTKKDELTAVFGEFAADLKHIMTAKRQGFYYSVAMVDAFFSRLEHMLVLLRAFCGTPMRDSKLTALLGMAWDDKTKVLVDVDDPSMQKLYSDLKRIKKRVRNPFAHGGVENDVHHRSLPFSLGDTRPDAPAGFLAVAAA